MKLVPFGICDAVSSQRDWAPRFLLINSSEWFRPSERDRKRLCRYRNNMYGWVLGCYYIGLWHCETKRAVMILLTTIIIILITDARGQNCGFITVRHHGKQSWSICNDKVNTEQKELFKTFALSQPFFYYSFHLIDIYLLLLQSALQPLVGFRPDQLSLSNLSRKVLQSAVTSGTSNPQLGGEPGI
jgi:hypothetical protein